MGFVLSFTRVLRMESSFIDPAYSLSANSFVHLTRACLCGLTAHSHHHERKMLQSGLDRERSLTTRMMLTTKP